MLSSVNLCGQLVRTNKSSFGFHHTRHLFINKNPNFCRFLRIQRFPNSISCLLQSIELNPQTYKDSLDEQEPNQEEEVELYTFNYLKNACGLSDGEAIYAAKRLMVKNKRLSKNNRAANADTVLALLREHGFSGTQISMAVNRVPFILIARPYETILPKIDFFQSIGFTHGAYREIVSRNPEVFSASLKCKLIPYYNALKEVLDSDHELICATMKKNIRSMRGDLTRNIVIQLNEMGFDPSRETYIYGVIALLRKDKTTWNQSYQKFLELGCSKDEILSEFRTRPLCMLVSVEKIEKVIDCLVNNMGWPYNDIVNKPYLFRHSIEKRIIPRCSVVLFLHSKGLFENLLKASTVLEGSEDYFIKRYVTKFAKVVPEVVQIYKGEVTFLSKHEK